jgi:hypothetical protein
MFNKLIENADIQAAALREQGGARERAYRTVFENGEGPWVLIDILTELSHFDQVIPETLPCANAAKRILAKMGLHGPHIVTNALDRK